MTPIASQNPISNNQTYKMLSIVTVSFFVGIIYALAQVWLIPILPFDTNPSIHLLQAMIIIMISIRAWFVLKNRSYSKVASLLLFFAWILSYIGLRATPLRLNNLNFGEVILYVTFLAVNLVSISILIALHLKLLHVPFFGFARNKLNIGSQDLFAVNINLHRHVQQNDAIYFWIAIFIVIFFAFELALPLAIILSGLKWSNSKDSEQSSLTKILFRGILMLVAITAFVGLPILLDLPSYFGIEWPQTPEGIGHISYASIINGNLSSIGIIILLAEKMGFLPKLPQLLKTVIVGLISGSLLVAAFALPTYIVVYIQYLPELAKQLFDQDLAYLSLFQASATVGITVVAATGPVAVLVTRPSTLIAKFAIGASSLSIAGAMVFGKIGAWATGIAAHAPIYDVALDRTNYQNTEWILRLAESTNNAVWFPYLFFLALMLTCIFIGGLIGVISPVRLKGKEDSASYPSELYLAFLLPFTILTWINIIIYFATYTLLGSQLLNVFVGFGLKPIFDPLLISSLNTSLLWITLIVLNFIGLFRLNRVREYFHYPQRTAFALITIGIINVLLSLLIYVLYPSWRTWVFVCSVNSIIIGLEFMRCGVKIWNSRSTNQIKYESLRMYFTSANLGFTSGLLGTILQLPIWSTSISLVMIAVTAIAELGDSTALPPGLTWLQQVTFLSFQSQYVFLEILLLLTTFLATLLVSLWFLWPYYVSQRWFCWIWQNIQTMSTLINHKTSNRLPKWIVNLLIFLCFFVLWSFVGLILNYNSGYYWFGAGLLIFVASVVVLTTFNWNKILSYFKHLSWPILLLTFCIPLVGSVSFFLRGHNSVEGLFAVVSNSLFLIPFIISAALVYISLHVYGFLSNQSQKTVSIISISAILGFAFFLSRDLTSITGGIARLDYGGREIKPDTLFENRLNTQANNRFYKDSLNQLWYGGGNSIAVEGQQSDWQFVQIRDLGGTSSVYTDEALVEQLNKPFLFEEDSHGFLWLAQDEELFRLEPNDKIIQRPGNLVTPIVDSTNDNTSNTSNIVEKPSCAVYIVNLWDMNGNPQNTFVYPSRIGHTISFAPDSAHMIIKEVPEFFRTPRLQLRDLNNHIVTSLNDTELARFSSTNEHILTFRDSNTALWTKEGKQLTRLEDSRKNSIKDAVFNSEGTQILGTGNGEAYLWDSDGNLLGSVSDKGGSISEAYYYEDDSKIVTNTGNRIVVRDTNDFATLQEFELEKPGQLTLSVDGTYFFVITDTENDKDVFIYNKAGKLTAHFDRVNEVQISAVNETAMLIDGTRTKISLWNSSNNKSSIRKDSEQVWSAQLSPDGSKIVVVWTNGQVQFWDSNGDLITELLITELMEILELDSNVENYVLETRPLITFSPDSSRIVLGLLAPELPLRQLLLFNQDGELLSTLNPDTYSFGNVSFTPDSTVLGATGCITEEGYEYFAPGAAISTVKSDGRGSMWVATLGMGIYKIDTNQNIGNSQWISFLAQNSGLLDDNVNTVLIDDNDLVWAGTDKGVSYFDGNKWTVLDGLPSVSITALMQDSVGRIWIGTNQGGYLWEGSRLRALSISNDEAMEKQDIRGFFEDSQSGIWVETTLGVHRYYEQKWEKIAVEVTNVSAFVEAPLGVIWFGGEQGLVRNDLRVQPNLHTLINASNGALATNWVRDLHVSKNDELWVSTFETNTTSRSPWLSIGLMTLLFSYGFIGTYRGYQRHPETIARHLWREFRDNQQRLYQRIYLLFEQRDNAIEILMQLANYFDADDDQGLPDRIRSLARLPAATEPIIALEQSMSSRETDIKLSDDYAIYKLHHLLMCAISINNVKDIVDLELTVNPSGNFGGISISWRGGQNQFLPEFAPNGMASAWQTLERLSTTLRKSQDVDVSSDSLSYLAQALTLADAAQMASSDVGLPEGHIMRHLANRWRKAVTHEIDRISGRSELRLELRTRQLRRSEQVTIVFQLHNIGRAVAENVIISLFQNDKKVGTSTLTRLAASRSETLEFAIDPPTTNTCRIVCQAHWEDRASKSHFVELGDTISFYETVQEFVPIANPYIVGHPIKANDMFHGREDVFKFISQNLSDVTDRTLILYGQRRTGKTSIMYQLLNGRLGAKFFPVLIDMQELAPIIMNTADFLGEIAYQLARNVQKAGFHIQEPDIEAFEKSAVRTFNRFLDRLEDNLGERCLVLMFDEFELIESKISEGKLQADLLGYFRSLMQHRQRIVFIFTGTHRLEEMSHDYWSILFNIALYRRVSFLNREDTIHLIREPVLKQLAIDELAVDKIIQLTRGHAYFTQLICWALINHCNQQRQNYATINDVNDAVGEILRTGESHFAYVWQQADRNERLVLVTLAHTIQPGKLWARPADLIRILHEEGEKHFVREQLVSILEALAQQEILESASEGNLRYRFQLEILQLWLVRTHSLTALIEKELAS